MKRGWYVVCRKCGASIFLKRFWIFAVIDLWLLRIGDVQAVFSSCGGRPSEEVVEIEFREGK